jgi:hypothetical protein
MKNDNDSIYFVFLFLQYNGNDANNIFYLIKCFFIISKLLFYINCLENTMITKKRQNK